MTNTLLIKPLQKRSKHSLERLLNASADQIATGNFENVSVAEITRQAKCSVGTFYGRFQNKAALFHVVQERVFNTALGYIDSKINDFEAGNLELTMPSPARRSRVDAVNFSVDLAVDLYSQHRGIFRAIFLHTRTKQDPALIERVQQFNAACMQASIRILKATGHGQSVEAVKSWQDGFEIIAVYLRESILFGNPVDTGNPYDLTAMKEVAASMFSAYLEQRSEV